MRETCYYYSSANFSTTIDTGCLAHTMLIEQWHAISHAYTNHNNSLSSTCLLLGAHFLVAGDIISTYAKQAASTVIAMKT